MTTWDYDLTVGQPNVDTHVGLLLAEDEALKTYVSGLQVPDKGGTRVPVNVWFRYPEGERRLTFPFITIDFLDISPDFTRWFSLHDVATDSVVFEDAETGEEIRRGMYIPSESPTLPEISDPIALGYHIEPYLMYKLTYQVITHARSALHDRYLLSRFMTDVFPPRSFWIGVEADHTWRRCELMDMTPADTMETTESSSKRIFRKVFTITMDAEISPARAAEIRRVLDVHIDITPDAGDTESIDVVPPPGP